GRTCRRMRLELAALGPVVRLVMMAHVAEQQTVRRAVHDEPDVLADAHRPEPLVLRLAELVERHPGAGRVDLQVEGSSLDRLLLASGRRCWAVGERVGDTEVHGGRRSDRYALPVRGDGRDLRQPPNQQRHLRDTTDWNDTIERRDTGHGLSEAPVVLATRVVG